MNAISKFKLVIALIQLVILFSRVNAIAGGEGVGGGKGVMCGNKLELLDIYEARKMGLTIPAPLGSPDKEAERFAMKVIHHMDPNGIYSESEMIEFWKNVMKRDLSSSPDSGIHFQYESFLPPTSDATLPHLEDGCHFVQIATFEIIDKSNVLIKINLAYLKQLDSINYFALFAHEFFYARYKSLDSEQMGTSPLANSDEIRRVVGHLMSTSYFDSVIPQFADGAPRWRCTFGGYYYENGEQKSYRSGYDFYPVDEVQDGVNGVKLYFFEIQAFTTVSRTVGFIPGMTVDQLVANEPFPEKEFIIVNPLMARVWRAQLKFVQNQPSGELSLRSVLSSQNFEPNHKFSTGHCFRDED